VLSTELKADAFVNVFLLIHRSIFDLAFYREVPALGRRAVILYVVKLLVIATVVMAVAHTTHLFSESRGVAPLIAAVMKGVTIREGRLYSERPLPFEIQPAELNHLYSRFLNIPATIDTTQTPRFIVDTAAASVPPPIPSIIMRSTDVAFYSAPNVPPQTVPYYKKTWYGPVTLEFTEAGVRSVLKKAVPWIVLMNLLWDGMCCATLVLFCICMLGLAAYIFRIERKRDVSYFLGIAGFAITPVPVGMVMVALANVTIPGSWQFLVIMAAVVMFRALLVVVKPTGNPDGGGER